MKLLAFLCNVILFGFTCMVISTDGMPVKTAYFILTLFLLLVPLFNLFVLWRSRLIQGWTGFPEKKELPGEMKSTGNSSFISPALKTAAAICNILLLGSCIWAFADQYPHPREKGFIAYILVLVVTPVLSIITILVSRDKKRKEAQN